MNRKSLQWVLVFVGVCGAASAQTRSTITGTVADTTGGLLPGVTTTLASPDLVGGAQVSATGADGTYRFADLPSGVYELTFELQGFRGLKRTALQLPFGHTLTVDVELEPAQVTETVTVTGAAPVVDVKSAAAPTRLEAELIEALPTDRRASLAAFELAPGVAYGTAFGGVRGAEARMIEGFLVNTVRQGSTGGSDVGYNWIEEVQVVGLGAAAEYGEFTAGAANVILRSGSNRFSGLFDAWSVPSGWVSDNRGQLPQALRARFAPLRVLSRRQIGAQAGGPLKRNTLFFFAAGEHFKQDLQPAGALGGSTNSDRDPRSIIKLNLAVSPRVKVEGFWQWQYYHWAGRGAGPLRQPETLHLFTGPGNKWNARFTWTPSDRTLVELRHSGYDWSFDNGPSPPNSRSGPPTHQDSLTRVFSGNTPDYISAPSRRWLAAATLTRYANDVLGESHEIKVGFEFEPASVRSESGIPGGRLFIDFGGVPDLVTLWDGDVVAARQTRTTAFLQDNWTLTNKLTIQPGLRMTLNRGRVSDQGTVVKTNALGPRIGLAWDLASDHKTVVRAHWGRFHEALYSALYEFTSVAGRTPRITARVLGPDLFQELNRVVPARNFGIDEDLGQTYVDQYTIGIERELLTDFSVEARYIRRNFRGIWAFVDTGSRYESVQRQDPGPDGLLNTADDGALLNVFNLLNPGASFRVLTNPEGAFRRYNAVQMLAKKRYSKGWQLVASYTWSRAEGNVNNASFEHIAGGAETGSDGVFANPNRAINSLGRSQFDVPHQVRLEGSYRLPVWGGFAISSIYNYNSGQPWGRLAVIRGLRQGNELVRIEPRGTRRLEAVRTVDLRLEKTFPLGSATRSLALYGDVLNLTNWGGVDSTQRGTSMNFIIQAATTAPIGDSSGPNFGVPSVWITPRIALIGVRVKF